MYSDIDGSMEELQAILAWPKKSSGRMEAELCALALPAQLREQENSFSVNIAHREEFIASMDYIYRQHCLDSHIKRGEISF